MNERENLVGMTEEQKKYVEFVEELAKEAIEGRKTIDYLWRVIHEKNAEIQRLKDKLTQLEDENVELAYVIHDMYELTERGENLINTSDYKFEKREDE